MDDHWTAIFDLPFKGPDCFLLASVAVTPSESISCHCISVFLTVRMSKIHSGLRHAGTVPARETSSKGCLIHGEIITQTFPVIFTLLCYKLYKQRVQNTENIQLQIKEGSDMKKTESSSSDELFFLLLVGIDIYKIVVHLAQGDVLQQ